MSETAAPRVTRRRAATRRRLLDAALDVFAAEGFGRSTVERICDRAGYTRGAFYSNFTSLDELFLAMWEQRSRAMIDDMRRTVDALDTVDVLDTADDRDIGGLRRVVQRILCAVPVDDQWFRVTAEFTAHALRNPALRRVMTAREESIEAAIVPIIEAWLVRAGRRVPDPVALGQALIAAHDGTSVQCLMEPDNPEVWRRRLDLFVHIVLAYSTESPQGAS